MPFGYVSPDQLMRDKADYAQRGVARSRSSVVLQYAGGILLVTPNRSNVLRKISELYDRIAFAAVGRYNEYENLRKAGVTYADVTGYQFDRADVTARGIANWYAQNLGEIFTASLKPFEVEIVIAEVGTTPDTDQIYRITFDGSVNDEQGFVAFGGQADQVAAELKEQFSDGMSLAEALGAALTALAAPSSSGSSSSSSSSSSASNSSSGSSSGNGQSANELTADQLEVAILDRARAHRTFRRLSGARLEELMAEARSSSSAASDAADAADSSETTESAEPAEPGAGEPGSGGTGADGGEPPTGPAPGGGDGIPKKPSSGK